MFEPVATERRPKTRSGPMMRHKNARPNQQPPPASKTLTASYLDHFCRHVTRGIVQPVRSFFSPYLSKTTAKLDEEAQKKQGRRRKKLPPTQPLACLSDQPPQQNNTRDVRCSTNASKAPALEVKKEHSSNDAKKDSERSERCSHRQDLTEVAGADVPRRNNSLTSTTSPEPPVRPPRKQSCVGQKKRRRKSSRRGSRRSPRKPEQAPGTETCQTEPTVEELARAALVHVDQTETDATEELRSHKASCSHAVRAELTVTLTTASEEPRVERNPEKKDAATSTSRRRKGSRKTARSSSQPQPKTVDFGTASLIRDAEASVHRSTQSTGPDCRQGQDFPEDKNERQRCQRTLSLRRPVRVALSPSISGRESGSNGSLRRRLSLRYTECVVSGALRFVTGVAAMLACEHRLRPRPFLGVLPRNCTSYSRDRACSTIQNDGDPGSRPTSAPGRCRTMSNSTQWASAAEANPQPEPEPEQQQQKQQQQAPECRGEPTPPAAAESPTAAPTGVDDLQQPPLTTPPPALAEPEAEVTREPRTTEAESTRPDASVRLQPPPSAASAESAHAQSSSKKPSPASSVASAAATTAVAVPDTKCEVERSPSWAGPSHVGVSVFEPPGGGDSGRVCGNLQNNNNGGSPPQETSGTTPARDKQSKTCCFCWCCCCSCSWRGSRPVYASLQKPVKLSSLALKSNNGNVRSPRDNNQRLTTGDSIFNGDGEPPPTLEEIRTWGDSFEKLMKCSAGRKVFRDFLKCEYSEENILFWLACEDLKKESNPELIEEKARAIYEDYISILSPKEVSLDSRVREIINRNMVEPTPHTFDEAQLQIYTLMHRDSYPRFVNSPLFRKLAQLPSPSRKGSAA